MCLTSLNKLDSQDMASWLLLRGGVSYKRRQALQVACTGCVVWHACSHELVMTGPAAAARAELYA